MDKPMSEAPASKPSLISVSDLFSQTWQIWKGHLKPLSSIAGIMLLPSILLQLLSVIAETSDWVTPLAVFIILAVISVVFSIIGSVALISYADKLDSTPGIGSYLRTGVKSFWSYLLVTILVALAVLVGLVLIVLPGIAVAVYFALATFVLVVEGKTGTQALGHSYKLVRGYWWATLGRLILLWLASFIISMVLGLVGLLGPWVLFIIFSAFYVLLTAFSTVYIYHVYKSLSAIKAAQPTVPTELEEPAAPTKD